MDTFLALKNLLREAHVLKKEGPTQPGPEIPRMADFLDMIQNTVHEAYRRWEAKKDAGDQPEQASKDSKTK